MKPDEEFVTFASRWRDMVAHSECYIPESQAVEVIARNTTGALKVGLLVGDFQTYLQLYDRASRVLRHKKDLPFLEFEGRGKKKTSGYTFEGIIGSTTQVSVQQGRKGQRYPQYQPEYQVQSQGQPAHY